MNITFFVAIYLPEYHPGRGEFCSYFIGRLIEDGCKHVAESTPVGIEVQQNQFSVGCKHKSVKYRCCLSCIQKLTNHTVEIFRRELNPAAVSMANTTKEYLRKRKTRAKTSSYHTFVLEVTYQRAEKEKRIL